MLEVTSLRNGTYYQEGSVPFEVISYEHIKMGRGHATVKVKVCNLLTGAIIIKSYISGKRVDEADLEMKEAEYKYRSSTDFVFEDDDGEEIELSIERVGSKGIYLKKGMAVRILVYEGDALSLTIPIKTSYTVKEAPPDARGNSAQTSYKEVVLENNLKVKAPMFIKEGDQVVIDTRDGSYVSRES